MTQNKIVFTKSFINTIRDSPLFQNLREKTVLSFLQEEGAEIEKFPQGSVIYDETHYRRALGLILKGSATVTKGDEGHRITMSKLKEGHLFGMAALFYEEEEFASKVTASLDTTVVFLSKDWLTSSFAKEPLLAANYITILSERIHFLVRKINTFTGSDGTDCLQRFLRDEYQRTNESELSLSVSMTTLATQLNISRASLYRSFQLLTEQGILERKGKKIFLLQPHRL